MRIKRLSEVDIAPSERTHLPSRAPLAIATCSQHHSSCRLFGKRRARQRDVVDPGREIVTWRLGAAGHGDRVAGEPPPTHGLSDGTVQDHMGASDRD